jgi:hypothetical protein
VKTKISQRTTPKTSGSSATEYDVIRRPFTILHLPRLANLRWRRMATHGFLVLTSPSPARQISFQGNYGTNKISIPTATSPKKRNIASTSMTLAVYMYFHQSSGMHGLCTCICTCMYVEFKCCRSTGGMESLLRVEGWGKQI